MSFNSLTFLFLFLPACLLVSLLADRRYRNPVLLAASLAFFAWGQWFYLPLMLLVIGVNYFLARRIEAERGEEGRASGEGRRARGTLILAIAVNLVPLVLFKLLVSYGAAVLGVIFPGGEAQWLIDNPLPLGFSYIAFQLISYQVDIYNEMCDSEKNFLNFSLYVLLFPKIITGPIARYRDLSAELADREITSQGVAAGIRRFILGLAKKVLIADQIARIVNPAFSLAQPFFSPAIAWVVVVGYAIQLYFDFSGFIDMAIGLGQMFGFHLPENFNYPYISRSIGEFWRRWHMTLSSWFRDYVFYPLEFTRRRQERFRQVLHVLIVFLLTGLWHGLTINFAIWGLIHGAAIAVETLGFGRWLKKAWVPLQHIYTLAVILLGWVFFRSPSLDFALRLLRRMAGVTGGMAPLPFSVAMPLPFIENSVWAALGLGILLSMPVFPGLQKGWKTWIERHPGALIPSRLGVDALLLVLLVGSCTAIVGNAFVASIYGGF